MKTKTKYQTVYIADDGTEFEDRQACVDYEDTILQAVEDHFMERITNCPELVDFPPFDGGEHSEFNKYLWIKPDNEEDVCDIVRVYGDGYGVNNRIIGSWTCLEIGDGYVFATTLNESVDYARKVLKELSYEMIIQEATK